MEKGKRYNLKNVFSFTEVIRFLYMVKLYYGYFPFPSLSLLLLILLLFARQLSLVSFYPSFIVIFVLCFTQMRDTNMIIMFVGLIYSTQHYILLKFFLIANSILLSIDTIFSLSNQVNNIKGWCLAQWHKHLMRSMRS